MLRSRLAMKAALVSALGIGALFAPKRADASTHYGMSLVR